MTSATREKANRLLAGFGAAIGLDGFALDETGHAQIALDEVFVTLGLSEERDSLVLIAPVGRTSSAEVHARLLDANMFWAGTAGGTLARESTTGAIVLLRDLPLELLDGSRFEAAVQTFVDAAEQLAEQITRWDAPEAADQVLPEADFRMIQV